MDTKGKVRKLQELSLRCSHVFPDMRKCQLLSQVGQRKCVRHGGRPGYGGLLNNSLSNVYIAFHTKEDKLDLTGELALQRTMLSAILLKMKDTDFSKLKEGTQFATVQFINDVTLAIAKTVKTISDVQNSAKEVVHVDDIKFVTDGLIEILFESGIPADKIGHIAERLNELSLPIEIESNGNTPEEVAS